MSGALSLFTLSACEQNYGIKLSSTNNGTGTTGGTDPGTGNVNPTIPGGIPTSPPSGGGTGTSGTPVIPPVTVTSGLLGGHFDVDTATTISAANSNATVSMAYYSGNAAGEGTVTAHVHEYDKVNKTTTVDFFNLSTKSVQDIAPEPNQNAFSFLNQNKVPLNELQNTVPATQRFYLIAINSTLNPGAMIQINGGTPVFGTVYQSHQQAILGANGKPQAYTIGTPSVSGDIQLTDLLVAFDPDVQANNLLIPTAPTNCVFPNIVGAKGEYRDGAFTIQAVDPANFIQDSATGAAIAPIGGMLWEGIIYNHFMIVDSNGDESDPEYCYGMTLPNGQIFY